MTKQIWKNYFDIVILPPAPISNYAIKLSKGLSKYGTAWTLGARSYIPHISLYHIAVKPKFFNACILQIEKSIHNFDPGYLRTTFVESNILYFDKPGWINKLYMKIIQDTLPYYDWSYGTDASWQLDHFPENMRKIGSHFIKKYGTPLVGRNFKPHITLTSFAGAAPTMSAKKARKFKFRPSSLYVCELGPSHSCQRIVKEISFT